MINYDLLKVHLNRLHNVEHMIAAVQKNVISTMNTVHGADKTLQGMELMTNPLLDMLLSPKVEDGSSAAEHDLLVHSLNRLMEIMEKIAQNSQALLIATGEMMLSDHMMLGRVLDTVMELQESVASLKEIPPIDSERIGNSNNNNNN